MAAADFTQLNLNRVQQLRQFKIDYSQVRNLEYVDKDKLEPQRFLQFRQLMPQMAMAVEEVPRAPFPADLKYLQNYSPLLFPKGRMLVLVNSDLYPQLNAAIDTYIADVAYEGYFATAYRIKGGSPAELRNFIIGKKPVVGALLVGSLPTAWFEMDDDFHNAHAEFPCDLYYMDLDGQWNDPDSDGKFSGHSTNVAPEIWIGRLWTPTANGNDATLLSDYFARNHQFRKGRLGCSDRALAYVDDDWQNFGDCGFDLMFPPGNIEVITEPGTTDGDRYKAEINQLRGWAQVCAHSSPGGHSFKANGSSEWVAAAYLRDVNPPNAYFYNLFACSNARFTQPDYMGGWYIFDKAGGSACNGLVAVGSTKTGSMLAFENFYGPMGSGKTTGDAFVAWWKAFGSAHELGERQWYYGMVLLGDPTLNWWSGAVPQLRSPLNNDKFDHFPRLTHFQWSPLGLGNTNYQVEIDAFGARNAGKWAAETGQTWLVSGLQAATLYEHMFVGAQRGRWRVRAKVHNQLAPWSDWSYFNYTV